MIKVINSEIVLHQEVASKMGDLVNSIELVANLAIEALNSKAKIILFGNGGSAADAQHIAAELVGRYKTDRDGLAAIALTTDSSILTSIGNDFGDDEVFKRQLQALLKDKDLVIGISTSGNSKNVINALDFAKKYGAKVVGFSGCDGGKMNDVCTTNIVIPSYDTPRIQEMHILIGHTLCHLIDLNCSN